MKKLLLKIGSSLLYSIIGALGVLIFTNSASFTQKTANFIALPIRNQVKIEIEKKNRFKTDSLLFGYYNDLTLAINKNTETTEILLQEVNGVRSKIECIDAGFEGFKKGFNDAVEMMSIGMANIKGNDSTAYGKSFGYFE